jgi:hypothetical protein
MFRGAEISDGFSCEARKSGELECRGTDVQDTWEGFSYLPSFTIDGWVLLHANRVGPSEVVEFPNKTGVRGGVFQA